VIALVFVKLLQSFTEERIRLNY